HGRREVEDAERDVVRADLEAEALVGIGRREVFPVARPRVLLGRAAVDRAHDLERALLLAATPAAEDALDLRAGADPEALDHVLRDVDVARAREVAVLGLAEEAVAVLDDEEDAADAVALVES